MTKQLAICGGEPMVDKAWPVWPQPASGCVEALSRVLTSGRWAISGAFTGTPSEEQNFAERFASYLGSNYCIPVDHGTSAIILALQAVGVSPGDEVIVPTLTWVACADAIITLGAVPVFVDSDNSMCISPAKIELAITKRTKAVLCVHLYCNVADLDSILRIAHEHGLKVIEDCAQAHGAMYGNRFVGTYGEVGVFSMQQGKPLTCGEGGCCVTDDPEIADRIYLARTNGRRLRRDKIVGEMELEEFGKVFGRNSCLSEFQCAILSEQLSDLDAQIEKKNQAIAELGAALRNSTEFSTIPENPGATRISPYHWVVRAPGRLVKEVDIDTICAALSHELNVWVHPIYTPIHRNRLFAPGDSPWARSSSSIADRLLCEKTQAPCADELRNCCIAFHHSLLLAAADQLSAIPEAIRAIESNTDQLQDLKIQNSEITKANTNRRGSFKRIAAKARTLLKKEDPNIYPLW